jgi:hypothetical protein
MQCDVSSTIDTASELIGCMSVGQEHSQLHKRIGLNSNSLRPQILK